MAFKLKWNDLEQIGGDVYMVSCFVRHTVHILLIKAAAMVVAIVLNITVNPFSVHATHTLAHTITYVHIHTYMACVHASTRMYVHTV